MSELLKEIFINGIEIADAYFYILECSEGSFYCGSMSNIFRRLEQHRGGQGANFTKNKLPVKLIYIESFDKLFAAFQREKQIQGWSRAKKIALIKNQIDILKSLSRSRSNKASE